ncbi:MAG: hypothetical protein KVP17_002528, partial [Porospora cf. gigantea B]|uniref:uncharacterized protein n=1 Tax=Porospora cf. gigantea B TaxID=2853592 RepID=UPI003571B67F
MRLVPSTHLARTDIQALVASTLCADNLYVEKRKHSATTDKLYPPSGVSVEAKILRPREVENRPDFAPHLRSLMEDENIYQKLLGPQKERQKSSEFAPHLRFMMDDYSSDSIEPLSESGVAALAENVANVLGAGKRLPNYRALTELHDLLIGDHPSVERIEALRIVDPILFPALLSVSRITTRPCSYSFNIPTLAAFVETPRTPTECADMLFRSRGCLFIKLADCLANSWKTTAMWEALDTELYLGTRPATGDLTRTLQNHMFNLCNLNYTYMDSPLHRVQLMVVWDYILGLSAGTPFKENPLSWTALVSHLGDLLTSRSLLPRLKVNGIAPRERASLAVEWGRELQKHPELASDVLLWNLTEDALDTSTGVSEPQAASFMVQRGLLGHFTPRQWQIPDDMIVCSQSESFQMVLGMPFCRQTDITEVATAKADIQKAEEEAFAADFIAVQGLFSPEQRAAIARQQAETSRDSRRWPSLTGYPGAKPALCAPRGRPHWRVELEFVVEVLLSLQQHKYARVRLPVLRIVLRSAEHLAARVVPKSPCTEAVYVALESLPIPDAGDHILLDTLDCLAKGVYLPKALDFMLDAPEEVNGALVEIIEAVSTILTCMRSPTTRIARCLKACLNPRPPACLNMEAQEDPGHGTGSPAPVACFSETPPPRGQSADPIIGPHRKKPAPTHV